MGRYRAVDRARGKGIPPAWSQPEPDSTHLPAKQKPSDLCALFTSVARVHYDDNPPDWNRTLKALNLRLCYQPAVAEVLQQDRWQNSKNPRAYVATAAYRRALALELPYHVDQVKEVQPDGTVKSIRFRTVPSGTPCPKDPGYGEDEDGNKFTEEEGWGACGADSGSGDSECAWESRIPGWLQPRGWMLRQQRHHESDGDRVDWQKVAEIAVQKGYMRRFVAKALRLRFEEFVPLETAVREERKPEAKCAIAAAYKWIDRNKEERVGRISLVLQSETEIEAREKLYGKPTKRPNPRAAYLKASAVLDSLISKNRLRVMPPPNDGPGLILDQVKYGF
jgi:hypothetical protein